MLCAEQTRAPGLEALGLPWKMSAELWVSNGRAAARAQGRECRKHPPPFKGRSRCFWEESRSSGARPCQRQDDVPPRTPVVPPDPGRAGARGPETEPLWLLLSETLVFTVATHFQMLI